MPHCPVCRVQADPIAYEGVRIYNCGQCGGHWLSDARLDVILERRDVAMPEPVRQKMMDLADASHTSDTLLCMTCGREMRKERFKYWDDIQLDRCPKCNGLWLDRGELEKCQIYWEYAEDNPEEWEHAEVEARKAMLVAELDQRRRAAREQRREVDRWGRSLSHRRALNIGNILGRLFSR